MRKNSISERAKRNSPEVKKLVKRSMAISKLISEILDRKGLSQKDLADKLGKKESEISKWLRGTHNFTFKTIGKIESVLEESLIYTADEQKFEIMIPLLFQKGRESVISYVSPSDFMVTDTEGKSFKVSVTKHEHEESVSSLTECQLN
jgi:transcriptional regulator with XRE-family HTH domain